MQGFTRNIIVLVMLFIGHLAAAQQVITAEYFWDVDPGQGSATPILALDGNLDEAIEDLFTNSVSIPAAGLHTFNIRIKGLENTWSTIFSYVINVGTPVLSTRDLNVVQAEYFWDTDPGLGSATPILALDGNLDEAVEDLFAGSVASPPAGLHTFNIRIKGLDATWSNLFSYVVNVSTQSLISRDSKVIQAEYFWDTDPGVGSATIILALDGNLDEVVEDLFDGALASPPVGLHKFNIRVKAVDGLWSNTFSYVVNVATPVLLTRDLKVTQAEYFWDTDPGEGSATVLLALDGNLDEAIEDLFESSVSIPTPGLHKFNVRVKAEDNTWSNIFSYVINVGTPTLITRDVKVIQAEYFWDVDPGLGSGSPILALDGNLDEAVEDVFKNTLSSTSIGVHLFNLRVKGLDNNWSQTFKYVVNVLDSNSYVSFNEVICDGSSYTVPSGDETYTLPGIYNDTILNANGYDSVMTITLTVDLGTSSTINPIACVSYLSPELNTYTSTGTYIDVIPNAGGCDSTITINLTILPNSSATISAGACDTYTSPSGNHIWTSSGTYLDTIPSANGCDSLLTINLIISTATSTTQNISACDSYLWSANGQTYLASGTYVETLVNAIGCDSIVTLNLTVNYSYTNSISVTTCDSYIWAGDGNTYTASGLYTLSLFTTAGCDSILSLDLAILNSTSSTQIVTTCDSYTWPLDGNLYAATGSYVATIANAAGCDSVVTLNLTINNSSSTLETVVACDSYFWPTTSLTYSTSGIYILTLTNAAGCDSLVTLDLTIGNTYSNTDVVTACDSYIWPGDGNTYTTSGFYTNSLLTPEGCDSILNLDLTINLSTTATQTATACDSYTWPLNANTYSSTGSYLAIIPNSVGCDSVVTLNLTINNSTTSSESITACDSYLWSTSGNTYTSTGAYIHTLPNAVGCDSLITLNLTINNSYSNTDVITACGTYLWAGDGNSYTTTGFYTVSLLTAQGCDSILNLDLTINTGSTASISLTACDLYTWPLNANSYASSGIYFATIPNAAGCDSVVTLNLTINNSSTTTTETIAACNSYLWPATGNTYTISGSYPTTLTTASGCDSVVTLILTIGYSYSSSTVVTACDSYLWSANTTTYTTSGIYTINAFTALGCDSILTLDLTIGTSTTATQTISACDGYIWPLDGNFYGTTGSYLATIPNALGCDSVVTLNLTINSSSSGSEIITACDSYLWPTDGNTYTSTGSYLATITNAAGCDSVITLNLTINNGFSTTDVVVACNDYLWPADGNTYTNSGLYTLSLLTATGCDSILNLDLTVGTNSTATQIIETCASYTWPLDANTYSSSGMYSATIPNATGCDSIVTLDLTINSPSSGSESISVCGSYTWSADGNTYANTGSYVATLTNAAGCDSSATLNLTVAAGTSSSETLSACTDYFWSATGNTYTTSGTYSTTLVGVGGCDSVLTLILTVNNVTAGIFQTGNILTASPSGATSYEWLNCATGAPIVGETGQAFTATVNGDYAVVVNLNGCADTSVCLTVTTADINKHFMESISISPNPTEGNLRIDLGQVHSEIDITVRDLAGRIIESKTHLQVNEIDLYLEQPSGMYLIEIGSNDARAVFKIVKK